ncbi:MAG: PKD domain-containing protein [Thermoplasmatales archaeon]|nr:PKD domain-containing protein [Thermoplasmatales archaeon]
MRKSRILENHEKILAVLIVLTITSTGALSVIAERSVLPDLTVGAIIFSNESPNVGENITVSAIIYNNGGTGVTNATVRFFDNNVQLCPDEKIDVSAGSSTLVAVGWTATAGSHTIKVVVDPDNNITESDETNNERSEVITVTVGLVPHDPIYINSNSNFTSANGVSNPSAAGTPSDPYIIENWDINASSADGIGIRNTTAYFIIRNCKSHNGKTSYKLGILFYNVTNGKIDNVTSYNNSHGIYLWDSSNNTITNCAVYNNNYYGTCLESSSNNNITNCAVYNNPYGIWLFYSSSNNITGCSVYNTQYGILLDSSSNNKITNCAIYSNVRGIPIMPVTSPEDATDSINNVITNCSISNNDYGVYIPFNAYAGAYNNYIHHNNFINNTEQARDGYTNYWDNGYPSGGNYWSDYTGVDNYSGANQDAPGSDGIGDTPYDISHGTNKDNYPLMTPLGNITPNQPPTVTITYPTEGQTVNETVTITGNASDTDGYVVGVYVKIDDGGWQTANGTSAWSFIWDTTKVGNGAHTIYARAWDGTDYSAVVSVNVNVENALDVDLYVTSEDISFSDANVSENVAISIASVVRNSGSTAAGTVPVTVYATNLSANTTTLLGVCTVTVGQYGANIVSADWPSRPRGLYMIRVCVDEANLITETDKENNNATRVVSVGGLYPGGILIDATISPGTCNPGATVTISGKATYVFGWDVGMALVCIEIENPETGEYRHTEFVTSTYGYFSYNFVPYEKGTYNITILVTDNTFLTVNKYNLTVEPVYLDGKDLVPAYLSFSDTEPWYEQEITITAEIRNTGTENAADVEVKFYDLGAVVQPQDKHIGTYTIPTLLGMGGIAYASITYEFTPQSDETYWETHRIKVSVDPENMIAEVKEDNNNLTETLTGSYRLPDLDVLSMWCIPEEIILGDTVEIYGTVKNKGKLDITTPFTVTFYSYLTPIDTKTIDSLSAGCDVTVDVSWTPANWGPYLLTVSADSGDIISESNEGWDNLEFMYVFVHPPWPDFCPLGLTVSPEKPVATQTLTLESTIKNQGWANAYATVKFYDGLTEIGTVYTGEISMSGGTEQVSINHVPATPGWHSFEVIVFTDVTEWNPLNNAAIRLVYVYPNMPDLCPVKIDFSDSTPYTGQNITIYAEIRNQGGVDASSVVVRFYDDSILIGDKIIAVQGKDAENTTYIFYTFSSNGTHTVKVTVDPNNIISEYLEDNNELIKYITVHDPQPDLTVSQSDILFSNSQPLTNESINISAKIHNEGELEAENILVGFLDNGAFVTSTTIPVIAAGAYAWANITYIPGTVGSHQITVDIDPYNSIPEYDEGNNQASKTFYAYPPMPDLEPTSITFLPTVSHVGDNVTISIEITNKGGIDAYSVFVEVQNDTQTIAEKNISVIKGKNGIAATNVYWLPTLEGWYTITAIADPDNQINEYNESNNMLNKSIYVRPPLPELHPTSIWWEGTDAYAGCGHGENIILYAEIENSGGEPATNIKVAYYIDSVEIGDITIPSLGVKTSTTVSINWTGIGGEHTVKVIVDPDNGIPELNDNNNEMSKTISVIKPDIGFISGADDITFSNNNPYPEEQITVYIAVHNFGTIPAVNVPVALITVGPYGTDQILSIEYVSIGVGSNTIISFEWTAPAGVSYLTGVGGKVTGMDANPSNDRATRGVPVGDPANLYAHIAPLLVTSESQERGALFYYYKVTDQNGVPVNGVGINFNTPNYDDGNLFYSRKWGYDDGIVVASFDLSDYPYGTFYASVHNATMLGAEIGNLIEDADCSISVSLDPRTSELVIQSSMYGGLDIAILVEGMYSDEFRVVNDGQNIYSVQYRKDARVGVGLGLDAAFDFSLGAVGVFAGLEVTGGLVYDGEYGFSDMTDEEQQTLVNYLITEMVLRQVLLNPQPSIPTGEAIYYINHLMGHDLSKYRDAISGGVYAHLTAGAWANIGLDSPYSSSYDFSLLQAGGLIDIDGTCEVIFYSNGFMGYKLTWGAQGVSGIHLPGIDVDGPYIDVEESIEIIYNTMGEIHSLTVSYTLGLNEQDYNELVTSLPIKDTTPDWQGTGKHYVTIEYSIPMNTIMADVLQYLQNLGEGNIEIYNITDVIFDMLEIVGDQKYPYTISVETPVSDTNLNVDISVLGYGVERDTSLRNAVSYVVEKGVVYRGHKYPIAQYNTIPDCISMIDFFQSCWQGRSIMETLSDLFVVTIDCPVNISITDQYNRTIGYKDGEFVNEIPDAYYTSFGERTMFYLPLNLTYTITVLGTDSGMYNLEIFGASGNSTYTLQIMNSTVTSTSVDIIQIAENWTNINISVNEGKTFSLNLTQAHTNVSVTMSMENMSLFPGTYSFIPVIVHSENPTGSLDGTTGVFFKAFTLAQESSSIKVYYTDKEIIGIDPNDLLVYKYNATLSKWELYTDATLDINNNTITLNCSPGIYGLFGTPIPELYLTQDDIIFSTDVPIENETISINVTIYNIGKENATDVLVQFYDGTPETGILIENKTITILKGCAVTIGIECSFLKGLHNIYVVINPSNTITENDYSNNQVSKLLPVTARPIANLMVSATDVYTYVSITFDASASYDPDGNITGYYFDFGDGNTTGWITTKSIIHYYTDGTANYTVTLKVKDDLGVESYLVNKTILVRNTLPQADAGENRTLNTNYVLFNASNSTDIDGVIVNYTWDFGDGNISYSIAAVHIYGAVGNYTVTLTVVDDDGDSGIAVIWCNVTNLAPTANITAVPTECYTFEDVTLSASASYDPDGTVTEYFFDFGDGTNSGWVTTPTITHSYTNGTDLYNVTLMVIDDAGATNYNIATVTLTIHNRPPTANAGENLTTLMNYIVFDAANSTDMDGIIINYTWEFGDGTIGYDMQPVHIYWALGNYTINLTVTDDDDATATVAIWVNVTNLAPMANLTVTALEVYTCEEIIFNASGSYDGNNNITAYYFDFGDGDVSGWITTPVVVHNYTDGTKYYTVALFVKDEDGITNFNNATFVILVHNRPPVADAGENQELNTNTVTLSALASTDMDGIIVNYTWNFGDGAAGYGTIVTHTYTITGKYTVTLTLKDDDGDVNTTSIFVTINNLAPIASAGNDMTFYTLENIIFNASASYDSDGYIINYIWDLGDGNTSYGIEVNHAYLNNGVYKVTLMVGDDDGATAVDTIQVTVRNRAPSVFIDVSAIDVYTYDAIIFDASNSTDIDGTITHYIWDFGDNSVGYGVEVTHIYTDNGIYTVLLTVVDDDSAMGNKTINITVNNRLPVANITISPADPTDLDNILFFDMSTDPDGDITMWYWEFGDGTTSTSQNPTHQYSDDGIYYVNLTITDNDGATDACQKSIIINNVGPTANFTCSPLTPTATDTIEFNDTSVDHDGHLTSWYWEFGDGTNATAQNTTHKYAKRGDYIVNLTICDDDGAYANYSCVVTVINSRPHLTNATITPETGDTETEFTFRVTYSDVDGDAPQYIRIVIDGVTYDMIKISGDYIAGAIYEYKTKLSAETHNYKFECDDGSGTVTNTTSTSIDSLSVVEKPEEKPSEIPWLYIIISIILIVVLIGAGLGVKRMKKQKPVTVKCKKCGETIKVTSAERLLSIVCPKCGMKGTLK